MAKHDDYDLVGGVYKKREKEKTDWGSVFGVIFMIGIGVALLASCN